MARGKAFVEEVNCITRDRSSVLVTLNMFLLVYLGFKTIKLLLCCEDYLLNCGSL